MKGSDLKVTLSANIPFQADPSNESKIVFNLPAGTLVTVLDAVDGWLLVSGPDDERGWFQPRQEPGILRALRHADPNFPVSVFHRRAFEHLQTLLLSLSGQTQRGTTETLGRLLEPALLLDDLANDAQGYLAADPNAESRFVGFAETLLEGPVRLISERVPSDGFSPAATLPPSFQRKPSIPCLFDPFGFERIFQGLGRVAQTFGDRTSRKSEEIFGELLANLTPLLQAADRLESVYHLGRDVDMTDEQSRQRFRRGVDYLAAPLQLGTVPIESLPPVPFPYHAGVLPPLDPCRAERWARTARAVKCFCHEFYEVSRIVNQDHRRADGAELVGEGCRGDLIEIQGRGFGASRDWGWLGQSEVVFSGNPSATVTDADYVSWSDTSVQVRVPAEAGSGVISLRVLCSHVDVGACGVQLRIARGDPHARMFTIPDPPVIRSFIGGVATRCDEYEIAITVDDAEVASVSDDAGTTLVFPEGAPGPRRTINAGLAVSASETRNYTIIATNTCGEATATATVTRRRGFELLTPNVVSGLSAELTLLHHCTPGDLGWAEAPFILRFEDPDGVLIDAPDRIVVAGDEDRATLEVATRGCGRVVATATAEDPDRYDHAMSAGSFFVYQGPWLNEVRPVGANACDRFRFELLGDCIVLDRSRLSVVLTHRTTSGRAAIGARVVEVVPGAGGSSSGATVICESASDLGEEEYDVILEQFGQRSNALSLTPAALRIPAPVIGEFTASRSTVPGDGSVHTNDLHWTVRHAARIALWASGGRLGRGEGVLDREEGPEEFCLTWSGSYHDRIQTPLRYELRAYPYRGTEPTIQTLEITSDSEPAPTSTVTGLRELRIRNCAPDHHTIHVWTRVISPTPGLWEEQGSLRAGYDRWGTCPSADAESLMISLQQDVEYEVRFIDTEQSTCPGNDPDSVNCWRLNPPAFFVGDEDGPGADWVFPGRPNLYP